MPHSSPFPSFILFRRKQPASCFLISRMLSLFRWSFSVLLLLPGVQSVTTLTISSCNRETHSFYSSLSFITQSFTFWILRRTRILRALHEPFKFSLFWEWVLTSVFITCVSFHFLQHILEGDLNISFNMLTWMRRYSFRSVFDDFLPYFRAL